MGLGAPKRRAKLSHDPNNTNWSRSSTKFGQRILESQGWTPGNFLGATSAQHTELHTRASTSHIRIALKDDNLGLGARVGSDQDAGTTTGLDSFQNILSRLNGKSEAELERAQSARSSVQRSAFRDRRWGTMQFVSGGFLVGDELEALSKKHPGAHTLGKTALCGSKRSNSEDMGAANTSPLEGLLHKKIEQTYDAEQLDLRTGRVKDSLGASSIEDPDRLADEDSLVVPNSQSNETGTSQKANRSQRKAEKAERKLERKFKREAKNTLNVQRSSVAADSVPSESRGSGPLSIEWRILPTLKISESVQWSQAPQIVARSRNAVRQRQIQHKRMSILDSKALNEVAHYQPPSLSPQC